MKKAERYLFFRVVIILMIVISGCAKENDCRKLSDDYFPNRVGNWWLYDRFDSLALEATSLKVEIIKDSVAKDGYDYKMWVYSKSRIYDTLYVRTTKDSVLFYRYLEGFPIEIMLKPLSVGQGWVHPVMVRDSTHVLSKDTAAVQYENFTNAYRIRRRLFAFNDYLTDDRWFVPNLGIVKLQNWHYLFGWMSKENWYLKDYSVGK